MQVPAKGSLRRACLSVVALLPALIGILTSRASGGYAAIDLYTITSPAGITDLRTSSLPQAFAGGQVAGEGASLGGSFHAVLWQASGIGVDLNPAGASASAIDSTNGVQQVGYAGFGEFSHAFLWNGTVASAVDLNPAGFDGSEAIGTNGTQQVGTATKGGPPRVIHAFLWNGSASSATDLNPVGASQSFAVGTDGVHQVGFGSGVETDHAILWAGTAASAVDLSPTNLSNFDRSYAYAVRGNEQVGWGSNGQNHALLWRGAPDSAVDLNPAGATTSYGFGTNGTQEVGEMDGTDGQGHAVIWSGTANSAVDLKQYLPAGWGNSVAYSIDPAGNVFGIAYDAAGHAHAVEWQVPEPASLASAGLVILALGRTRGDRPLAARHPLTI